MLEKELAVQRQRENRHESYQKVQHKKAAKLEREIRREYRKRGRIETEEVCKRETRETKSLFSIDEELDDFYEVMMTSILSCDIYKSKCKGDE